MKIINIAELLRNCPKGTELYSPIFGDVYLDGIRPHLAVVVKTSDNQKEEFLYDGRFGINGECMLFPSKENRDWSTFQRPFKDGDVLAYQHPDNTNPSIYIHKYSQKLNTAFYVALNSKGSFYVRGENGEALHGNDPSARFATEEEKQKLFDAIKDNGYKWNAETKTLEKLIEPKFKVGDKITDGEDSMTIEYIDNEYYYNIKRNTASRLFIKNQDNWKLVPDKFDISTLVPFESKVLVRNSDFDEWRGAFWSYLTNNMHGFNFDTTRGYYKQCIPYKGNEHLLGKTKNCDDFYKTW